MPDSLAHHPAAAHAETPRDVAAESEVDAQPLVERYQRVLAAASGVLWDWNLATNMITLGPGAGEHFGWEIDDVPVPLSWFHQNVHPEDIGALLARGEEVHATRLTTASHAYRFRRASGQWSTVQDHFHVTRQEDGTPIEVFGVMLDTSARYAMQEQLRQSQKMDAVGRLAGGIAHDFNNLLTVIRGNVSLALESLDATHPLRLEMGHIEQAAARATDLTRQLLAFSRKQVMLPQPLDINAIIAQLTRLLERLLPSTVTLRITPATETGLLNADRAQLEQVILNLVLNARDAMPSGGTLDIRTGEFAVGAAEDDAASDEASFFTPPRDVPIRPGHYVHMTIADSGTGMDARTLGHAFEPFFTTKAVGLGAGMGLATVYGIVKQSDGYVWIESRTGMGTTVHLCFPRYDGPVRRARITPTSNRAVDATQTILLVEDEPGVRDLALRVLERLGYHVLSANDGIEALALWQDDPARVDIVVTDVVMPRLGGSELVTRLRGERSDVPVLFMSGYARNAAIGDGHADRRTRFLQKPFTVLALQHAIADLVAVT